MVDKILKYNTDSATRTPLKMEINPDIPEGSAFPDSFVVPVVLCSTCFFEFIRQTFFNKFSRINIYN